MGWEMVWLSGPICLAMVMTMPETSADNILLRRARRLRNLTGRADLYSQSEVNQSNMTAHEITFNALLRPWEINVLDPAVVSLLPVASSAGTNVLTYCKLFSTLYVALVYGIFYSFLECFPLVYPIIYKWNLGESNLPFLTVVVALAFGMSTYMGYFRIVVSPAVVKRGWDAPENRLYIGLYFSWMIPIGLFIFGKCRPLFA